MNNKNNINNDGDDDDKIYVFNHTLKSFFMNGYIGQKYPLKWLTDGI